jgi:hypothetical protein
MQPHIEPRGFTGALSSAGLGIGSTADEISIAAPNGAGVDYAIKGIAYHLADDASVAGVPAALAEQAADTTCLYLVQVDSAGTVSMVKGTEVDNDDLTAETAVLHWPRPSSDAQCPIGAVKVKTVAVTFTAGTTNFSAAGVTDTYYNFAGGMPHVPLTA